MNLALVGILGIIILVVLIFLGVNIGFAMAAVGFFGFAIAVDFKTAFGLFRTVPFTSSASYSLSVIPLFVLMGQFAYHSGISQGLFDACEKWLYKMKGGLCVATIATSAGFAAICGSSSAAAATMCALAYPPMKKAGYDDGLATACIAAGGGIGVLIPPSTIFVIYSIQAMQSVGRLFAGGIIAGIILCIGYVIAIQILCRRNPSLAPKTELHYTKKEQLLAIKGAVPIIVLFTIVVGGIFSGIFTANEAAAVGALAGFIFMAIKKKLTFKTLMQAIYETVKITAMIFVIYVGASIFGYFLTITMIPITMANFVASLTVPRFVIILLIFAIYLFLGCFMDALAMLLLTVPIFLPIIQTLGYNEIWFGVMLVIMQQQAVMTPPVGMNVYIIAGMLRNVPMPKIFKGVLPFVLTVFIVAVLILAVPGIATWLPNLIYG